MNSKTYGEKLNELSDTDKQEVILRTKELQAKLDKSRAQAHRGEFSTAIPEDIAESAKKRYLHKSET